MSTNDETCFFTRVQRQVHTKLAETVLSRASFPRVRLSIIHQPEPPKAECTTILLFAPGPRTDVECSCAPPTPMRLPSALGRTIEHDGALGRTRSGRTSSRQLRWRALSLVCDLVCRACVAWTHCPYRRPCLKQEDTRHSLSRRWCFTSPSSRAKRQQRHMRAANCNSTHRGSPCTSALPPACAAGAMPPVQCRPSLVELSQLGKVLACLDFASALRLDESYVDCVDGLTVSLVHAHDEDCEASGTGEGLHDGEGARGV